MSATFPAARSARPGVRLCECPLPAGCLRGTTSGVGRAFLPLPLRPPDRPTTTTLPDCDQLTYYVARCIAIVSGQVTELRCISWGTLPWLWLDAIMCSNVPKNFE